MPVVLTATIPGEPPDPKSMTQGRPYLTEFWRNTIPDRESAERVETVQGLTFRDFPDEARTYYYWARSRTRAGKMGPWSAMETVEYEPVTKNGMRWTRVFKDYVYTETDLLTGTGIAAMANDGLGNVIAISGSGGVVLISRDNGKTWDGADGSYGIIPIGGDAPNIGYDTSNNARMVCVSPGVLVTGSGGEIYKSTDSGQTWVKKRSGANPWFEDWISNIVLQNTTLHPNTLVAAGQFYDPFLEGWSNSSTYAENVVVYYGSHKYTSLNNALPNLNRPPSLWPTFWHDDGYWFWYTIVSSDQGETWSLQHFVPSPETLSGYGNVAIDYAMSDDGTELICEYGRADSKLTIWRSTNGGVWWDGKDMPADEFGFNVTFYEGWNNMVSSLLNVGDGVILAGGYAFYGTWQLRAWIWRSADHGATWSLRTDILRDPKDGWYNVELGNGNMYASSFLKRDDGLIVCSINMVYGDARPGFRASNDGGLTWQVPQEWAVEALDDEYRGSSWGTASTVGFFEPTSAMCVAPDGSFLYGIGWDGYWNNGDVEIWRGIMRPATVVVLRAEPADDIMTDPMWLAEFWRSKTPEIATAEMLERRHGLTYEDDPDPEESRTWYYWTRLITPAGKVGAWSEMVTVEL